MKEIRCPTTMYMPNRRDSGKLKGGSPLQNFPSLISLPPEIVYFTYTQRYQHLSEYGNGFFVRVMTFYNGESLPLETENSKTDIHILIQPTELGYENNTFVISDFYGVDLESLEKKDNSVELTFKHGKFPRKKEQIIIKPESVRFKKNNCR